MRTTQPSRAPQSDRSSPWSPDVDEERAQVAGVLSGTAVLGTVMHRYTDAALPYPDAFTTLLSVFAQFLLTRKILENWTLWIIADVVHIGVYTSKSLYWTAGRYVVFLGLCVQDIGNGSGHRLRT